MPENNTARLRLAAWPLRARLFVTVCWAVMATAWILLLAVPAPPGGWPLPVPGPNQNPSVPPGASGLNSLIDVTGSAIGNVIGWIALIALIIIAVFAAAAVATVILTVKLPEAYLYAVWLTGTTLTVRHWYGARSWDLASAAVAVRASRTRKKAWVSVRAEPPRRLAPFRRGAVFRLRAQTEHIIVLADAITAARPGDPRARQAAETLTQVAAARPGTLGPPDPERYSGSA